MIRHKPLSLSRRDFALRDIGCIACLLHGAGWQPVDKHHLNANDMPGGKRRGERFTVGLCRYHHTGHCLDTGAVRDCAQCRARFGPSWRHHKRAFIERFGDGDTLLAEQERRIEAWQQTVIA